MAAESIYLLTAIFIHLSIIFYTLSKLPTAKLFNFIWSLHKFPLFSCLLAGVFGIAGITIVSKIFLIITLLLLIVTLGKTWTAIRFYLLRSEAQKTKNPTIKNNER